MHVNPPVRWASLAAAGALVAATLAVTAPTAQAAPVFSDPDSYVNGYNGSYDNGSCSYTETNSPTGSTPLVENGSPTSYSSNASSTHTGTGSDTATGASQVTATMGISSAGGLPSLDFSASGSSQSTYAEAPSDCLVYSYAYVYSYSKFTLTQPGVMHLTTKGVGKGAFGEIEIYDDEDSYLEVDGTGARFTGEAEIFLEPGTYWFYVQGGSYLYSPTSKAASGSITMHAEFAASGSQTEEVSGKGMKYVKLPSARSCATHVLTPSITDNRKRANRIKRVKFFINDTLVENVETPDRGDLVNLSVADDLAAEVRAKVKLFSAHKGERGKIHETTASYEACS